jgi:ABC-type nitrate/sulfonate/bicarbonate transport system permease component
LAVAAFSIPSWKLPAPSAIGVELWESRALFARHAWVTFQEAVVGFAIAFVLGVVLAALISSLFTFKRVVYPIVISSQTIPTIVIAPLLLIWVGYGLTPKVIVVILITFFPIVVNTVDGLSATDPDMARMMRTMGASSRQIFFKLRVPGALPFVLSGTKIAITFSVIGAVIAEWVASNAGLGYLTKTSVPLFLTARSFGAVVLLALMGIGLFLAASLLERHLLRWQRAGNRQWAETG